MVTLIKVAGSIGGGPRLSWLYEGSLHSAIDFYQHHIANGKLPNDIFKQESDLEGNIYQGSKQSIHIDLEKL